MFCCGNIIEITDSSDRTPNYLCQECGKQGGKSSFPDPPEVPETPLSFMQKVRLRIAEVIAPSNTY